MCITLPCWQFYTWQSLITCLWHMDENKHTSSRVQPARLISPVLSLYLSQKESYYFKSSKQTAYNAPQCSVTHIHAWTEIIWLSTWDWHFSLQTQPVLLSASYNTQTAEAGPPPLIYQGNFSLYLRHQVSTMSYISYKHFSTNKIQHTMHKNLFPGSHHSHISKTLSSYSQHAFCWQCWQHTQGSRYMIQ